MTSTEKANTGQTTNIRKLTVTAIMAAVSTALMFLSFNVPFMPGFIKMDLSELPALISSFSMGPLSGAAVCLIKNLVNLFFTTTGGVGELSNFILGCIFVVPAGIIYNYRRVKLSAIVGSVIGVVSMSILSVFSNYFIVYPIYANFIPVDAIIRMYKLINPSVESLIQCLIIFNMPFTFVKGFISVVITMIIYKKLSPLISGRSFTNT